MKLKNVEINPGRLCNNRCVFCMSGEERDDHDPWIPPEDVQAELKAHYDRGARSVGFLGGEPSVYPHILDSIRFARDTGYQRIALCTNGTRLASRSFADRAIEAGLTRVTVSVHSHHPEIEEFLTGVRGILDKKIRGIQNMVEFRRRGLLKDNISLNPVLCRPNAPHMEGFVRFFKGLGVDDIRFNYIWPQSRIERDKRVVPMYSEVVPWMLDLIRKNERELGLTISFGAVPYCALPEVFQDHWPLLRKYFYEEGNDLPTDVSFLRGEEDEDDSERFNWHKRSKLEYRGKFEDCRTCKHERRCMGVYRTYLELYGTAGLGDRKG